MSELVALVADPGYDDITHTGPDAKQYTVFGLRQEGEKPLDLPADGNKARILSEIALPLPDEQQARVREYFNHYFVQKVASPQVWDCRRFAGFVALDTPLEVSVLEDSIDEYSSSQDTSTMPGVAYEFFNSSKAVHSATGLGDGKTIGVNGLFGYMAVGGINELRSAYGDQQHRILKRHFSKSVSDDKLMEVYGGATIEEAEKLCYLKELVASNLSRYGMLATSKYLKPAGLDINIQSEFYFQIPELEPELEPIHFKYFDFKGFTDLNYKPKITGSSSEGPYDTAAIRKIMESIKISHPFGKITDSTTGS